MTVHKNKLNAGFTLIELLIVIAILGVLAVVVLVAINPVQQLARTRDAGRESGVTQIGHAIEAYAISHDGGYPVEQYTGATDSWIYDLVSSGEMSIVPAGITWSAGTDVPCTSVIAGVPETWCYDLDAATGHTIVYASLESDSKDSVCTTPATQSAFFVYSTAAGRGGIVCALTAGSIQPAAGVIAFEN